MKRHIAFAITWLSVAAYIFALFAYHPSFFWEIALMGVVGALGAIVNPDKGKPRDPEKRRIFNWWLFYATILGIFLMPLMAIFEPQLPPQNIVFRVCGLILFTALFWGGVQACVVLHVRIGKRLKPPTSQP